MHQTSILLALLLTVASLPATGNARTSEPLHAAFFTRAFSPDFVATADDALPGESPRPVKIFFRVSELGPLKITSGRLVAADPFVSTDADPLAVDVPNGAHPVRLAVLQGTMGRGRVAFARVDVSDAPAVRWEMTRPLQMQRDAENPDADWGVAIDSGVAAFFDPAAGKAADEAEQANEAFFDSWLEQGQNNGIREKGASGAFRLTIDAGPGNVVAFDTGWGDGVYAVYAGYDAGGNLSALIADFDILDWSKVKE